MSYESDFQQGTGEILDVAGDKTQVYVDPTGDKKITVVIFDQSLLDYVEDELALARGVYTRAMAIELRDALTAAIKMLEA